MRHYERDEIFFVEDLKLLQAVADGQRFQDVSPYRGRKFPWRASRRLRDKLGADNLAHAVAQGFRMGILR